MSHITKLAYVLAIWTLTLLLWPGQAVSATALSSANSQSPSRYACEPDLIEVVFSDQSWVRLRDGALRDFGTPALSGVSEALSLLTSHEWSRLTDLPEADVDALRERGIANTGRDVPDLNNVFRLRIAGADVWDTSARLEVLPGILTARPVPRPIALPTPQAFPQEYRAPAAWNPSGMGHDYFLLAPLGDGLGATVCDLEYAWNYDHADISKAMGSQINTNVANPFGNDDHGTAVAGMLVADDNGWGTTGLCPQANFRTCGTFFGTPPTWNPAGALLTAISQMPPGAVILLEQQWDYDDPATPGQDLIPVEWYTDTWPSAQSANAVYSAIQLATANNLYVVEPAGNGSYDLNTLYFAGDSGAIIVGAGGAYAGGTFSEGNLERLGFSSYGYRVNVQGWGENVVTTGYGNLYQEGTLHDYDYTDTFAGTSSASAHVAGAVAVYATFSAISGLLDPTTMRNRLVLNGTDQVMGPFGYIGPRPDLMRLYMLNVPPPFPDGGDFGDAPEGALAYPASGIVGQFPTVFAPTTPADYMMHAKQPSQLYLGNSLDFEYEGNGGLPFLNYYSYDFDECDDASPADDGLLYPSGHTIQGTAVVPCGATSTSLGGACGVALFGSDLDLEVVNALPADAFINILVDWNQDGRWGGSANGCGSQVPELTVENVTIPPTGPTPIPLSQLVPGLPPIRIGPNPGFVWMRVTLTDTPLPYPQTWAGGLGSGGWGIVPIGETEDYLIRIGEAVSGTADGGVNADLLRTVAFPNPFGDETTLRFDLAQSTDVFVDVFDVAGRFVRRIDGATLDPGPQEIRWDGRNAQGDKVAPGIYFATIRGVGGPAVRLHVVR